MNAVYKKHKNNLGMPGDIFIASLQNSDDTTKVHFVFIINWAIPGSTTSGITDLGGYKSVIYRLGQRDKTIIHELGHILNIEHTFPETNKNGVNKINYNIPKYSTLNFMDYYIGPQKGLAFYFAQWIDTF